MKTQASFEERSVALVYYIFAFLLLWEWLRPLKVFTETSNTFVFIFFIAVCFILIFLKAKWYTTFPVKITIILFILHGMFYNGAFFGFRWFNDFVQDTSKNIQLIPTANWMSMTAAYRTFLFFILLWLLVYLIHYWVLIQKRILIFFILTLLYITVLDTFTPYDATLAIVRTVLIGFFMLGMLYFDRLKRLENIKVKKFAYIRWMFPLFVFILLSIVVAVLAPKASPQWPDPVPYITAMGSESDGGGGTKKIGYSENDDQLGGGFEEDDTEVFTHISSERHYWRIETKDVYTGKGWVASDTDITLEEIEKEKLGEELDWIDDRVETISLESTVTFNENYQHFHVMYPLGLTAVETENDLNLYMNRHTELITPFQENEGSRDEFMSYKVEYELPSYPINEMRKEQSLSNEFIERYTQLPESLPSRVKDLAIQITANKTNQYDRAKAVEEYLGSTEFTYDKDDVAVPQGSQDYVDQFLFDTLRGYCDNFSTSMIVLLRAVDIPARWVKGYTEGDFVDIVNESDRQYQVTNNNAHSWVEVYFDGVGWVPFEPTKGFINPYTITNDEQANEGYQEQVDQQEEQQVEEEPEQPDEKEAVEQEEEEVDAASGQAENTTPLDIRMGSTFVYIILFVFLIVCFILYKTRLKWFALFIMNKYKNRQDKEVFFLAYESLLKQLERKGIKREGSQTLRDYAHSVDRIFEDHAMTSLTTNYERALYRRDNAEEEWKRSHELWENLIKRTSS